MLVAHLLKDECPICHKGKVFQNSNLFSLHIGKMNRECSVCHTSFTKEPGFYYGAMFVSYMLTTAEVFAAYIICRFMGAGQFDLINLWVALAIILLLFPFNFKMSRLIWLYLFPGGH
jgi:uncharacterized protein (DUF983 family)